MDEFYYDATTRYLMNTMGQVTSRNGDRPAWRTSQGDWNPILIDETRITALDEVQPCDQVEGEVYLRYEAGWLHGAYTTRNGVSYYTAPSGAWVWVTTPEAGYALSDLVRTPEVTREAALAALNRLGYDVELTKRWPPAPEPGLYFNRELRRVARVDTYTAIVYDETGDEVAYEDLEFFDATGYEPLSFD